MKWKMAVPTLLFSLLATSLSAGPLAGGDYVISRSTIDNGGGVSAGGDFVLTGTIGQPDATVVTLMNGVYKLAGGFWGQFSEVLELIFEDGFE